MHNITKLAADHASQLRLAPFEFATKLTIAKTQHVSQHINFITASQFFLAYFISHVNNLIIVLPSTFSPFSIRESVAADIPISLAVSRIRCSSNILHRFMSRPIFMLPLSPP